MLYNISTRYMTPWVRASFSKNRLKHMPKDEISEIYQVSIIVFAIEVLMFITLFLFIWARLTEPIPPTITYIIMAAVYALSFLLFRKAKKRGFYTQLQEEANRMIKAEHHAKAKKLVPIILIYYISPILVLVGACLFIQHFILV